jgi:hypothetical protein
MLAVSSVLQTQNFGKCVSHASGLTQKIITHHAAVGVAVVGVHLIDWNRFSVFDPNFDCFLG